MKVGKASLVAIAACGLTLAVWPQATPAQDGRDFLGVQTHFSQNWPVAALMRVNTVGARMLRDSAPWPTVEARLGSYRFDDARIRPLDRFCASGGKLLLTAVPRHPAHDGGMTAHTPAGMAAFARYVGALAQHFGRCLVAVEIGNEINGKAALAYPDGMDRDAAYVALMRTLRERVTPEHPALKLLGGSTNVIGTGFLKGLFAKGMLDHVDGVVVHPYRRHAENIDVELAHLTDAMKAAGPVREIWATEFSDEYENAPTAAPELIKFAALMGADRQVRAAFWYALNDQQWFRNMGLFAPDGRIKPGGEAFALLQSKLLVRGRPVRVDAGDPNVRLYRFGKDAWVVWGASGTMRFSGDVALMNPRGKALAGTDAMIADEPVIAIGATSFELVRGAVVADSLLGYRAAPFSYWARTADGKLRQLDWLDGPWTSFQGYRYFKPLSLGDHTGAPAGDAKNAVRPILRYTAAQTGTYSLGVCLDKGRSGDGIDVRITRGGAELARAVVGDGRKTFLLGGLVLKAGEAIDLEIGPNLLSGGDTFRYRMRVTNGLGNTAVLCS